MTKNIPPASALHRTFLRYHFTHPYTMHKYSDCPFKAINCMINIFFWVFNWSSKMYYTGHWYQWKTTKWRTSPLNEATDVRNPLLLFIFMCYQIFLGYWGWKPQGPSDPPPSFCLSAHTVWLYYPFPVTIIFLSPCSDKPQVRILDPMYL